MIIKKIKILKNKVVITFNDEKLELDKEVYPNFYLYEGKDISKKEYEKIKELNNVSVFLKYAMKIRSKAIYSEYQIREKLYKKEAKKSEVDQVIKIMKGYDLIDHAITSLSGIFGTLIVLFPCNCAQVNSNDLVGFFQLSAEVSHKIHCTAAVIFFILLAFNSLFLFTRSWYKDENGNKVYIPQTKQKKIKNVIFKVCGVGMLCGLILVPLPLNFIPAKVFIAEAIALTFFGVSWLIKGEVFGLLSDDKSN